MNILSQQTRSTLPIGRSRSLGQFFREGVNACASRPSSNISRNPIMSCSMLSVALRVSEPLFLFRVLCSLRLLADQVNETEMRNARRAVTFLRSPSPASD